MNYSIDKVATLIEARRAWLENGEICGPEDNPGAPSSHGRALPSSDIQFLLTDSRSLCFPDVTLFFAIKTAKGDGADYIPDLIDKGVRNFVVSGIPPACRNTTKSGINFLIVKDVLKALQLLAERHRESFRLPVVGITGSNGKTIVKEWLYQLLTDRVVTRSPRSYNSQIGVPLSVCLLDEKSELGLFEAGVSMPGEMEPLRKIIRPTLGVFTYLGDAHQENFPSLQQKCTEKLSLFRDAGQVVVGIDNLVVRRGLASAHLKGELLTWSMKSPDATLYVSKMEKGDATTTIQYVYKGAAGQFEIPFISDASAENAVTCALAALQLGVTPAQLEERMPRLEAVGMRLEVEEGRRGITIINDSYNSDINSLRIALDFMHRRPDHKGRRRTLILSDILQSGIGREQLYGDVDGLLKANAVEKLIGIGDDLCDASEQFTLKDKKFFHTVAAFLSSPDFRQLHDEVILLKGARRFGFEHIQELLVEKVHETTLEVNLSAVVANLNHYRSMMAPGTKLACMIKANAYGAGAIEIAKTLQDHRVDYLAVAVADEGVALRRAGITQGIMVMNPEMASLRTLFDYDLEPEVYSFRILDALVAAAEREGVKGFPCHIKLDTGMCRLGFSPSEDMEELVRRLRQQTAVMPKSVFSHFVGADSDDLDSFSAEQFRLFDMASKKLQAAFGHTILRHICNSAGIEHLPGCQLDMCRLGIGLYGINPRGNGILSTVSTLKTTILQLRRVPKGHSVGYGRRTMLDRDSLIAALPIGYADGLDRRLGNRQGFCIVNGQRAPYVGNICMDVCMADVTGIECREGDSAEIFGDRLPVTVLSDKLGTIPYEVMTRVSDRVKRVYFEE